MAGSRFKELAPVHLAKQSAISFDCKAKEGGGQICIAILHGVLIYISFIRDMILRATRPTGFRGCVDKVVHTKYSTGRLGVRLEFKRNGANERQTLSTKRPIYINDSELEIAQPHLLTATEKVSGSSGTALERPASPSHDLWLESPFRAIRSSFSAVTSFL
jgi:hypothetical protein